LTLLSIASQRLQGRRAAMWMLGTTGALAVALFYGDAVITPAISVLAAVEGIGVAAPPLSRWALPLALLVLVALFAFQHRGAASLERPFGGLMLAWFAMLAVAGAYGI